MTLQESFQHVAGLLDEDIEQRPTLFKCPECYRSIKRGHPLIVESESAINYNVNCPHCGKPINIKPKLDQLEQQGSVNSPMGKYQPVAQSKTQYVPVHDPKQTQNIDIVQPGQKTDKQTKDQAKALYDKMPEATKKQWQALEVHKVLDKNQVYQAILSGQDPKQIYSQSKQPKQPAAPVQQPQPQQTAKSPTVAPTQSNAQPEAEEDEDAAFDMLKNAQPQNAQTKQPNEQFDPNQLTDIFKDAVKSATGRDIQDISNRLNKAFAYNRKQGDIFHNLLTGATDEKGDEYKAKVLRDILKRQKSFWGGSWAQKVKQILPSFKNDKDKFFDAIDNMSDKKLAAIVDTLRGQQNTWADNPQQQNIATQPKTVDANNEPDYINTPVQQFKYKN